MAVAIFHSISKTRAPDPIVYHVGGPGGHMQLIVPYIYEKVIAPFLETRDLILLDPRGTGYSQPALECRQGEEAGDCVRRLFAEGHDLYSYNSKNMAADLQDLRKAIGYDSWNLLGESYGTHVTQIVLREAPEGLRSVILDAVMPIVVPELPGGKSTFELSLGRLFARCRQDAACNKAYPNLKEKLNQAVQRLNERPFTLSFDLAGKAQTAVLTGDRLLNEIMTALYEIEMIPYLPYAISTAADGSDYDFWDYAVKWDLNTGKMLSQGAHWAILCGDGKIEFCDNWPVSIEKKPVTSEIPTLVLNGEFDPVTPPEYGYSVAQGLSPSYFLDFPGMGHWVNGTGHPCQISIIQDFLENPADAPDSSCIAEMNGPVFFIAP